MWMRIKYRPFRLGIIKLLKYGTLYTSGLFFTWLMGGGGGWVIFTEHCILEIPASVKWVLFKYRVPEFLCCRMICVHPQAIVGELYIQEVERQGGGEAISHGIGGGEGGDPNHTTQKLWYSIYYTHTLYIILPLRLLSSSTLLAFQNFHSQIKGQGSRDSLPEFCDSFCVLSWYWYQPS
jgi:hypothetical protein